MAGIGIAITVPLAVASSAGAATPGDVVGTVTAVDGTTFTLESGVYTYDRNDEFAFGAEGEEASFTEFREALSVGDDVQVFAYSSDPDLVSGIALLNDSGEQVTNVPTGGVDTGGGSTAGVEAQGLLVGGVAALTIASGLVMAAQRKRA